MATTKNWTITEAKSIIKKPFLELLFEAQKVHRKHFIPGNIQVSTLLSIKTGLCPEDCKYCPQSARYKTNLKNENLVQLDTILEAAKKAKQSGATRFCMGAAWKNPKDKDMPFLEEVISHIKNMGLETCMTLGTLSDNQAMRFAKAGLDFYNHNLDTSPEFYKKIITTRSYQDRLDTIDKVRKNGIKVCSGGIIGLGENLDDRIGLLVQLANLEKQPESVPVNMLVKVKGTPLEKNESVDLFEFIRVIATARILMPNSRIRLSAGREQMNEQAQALCFLAGANSIFYGCKLLTTSNPQEDQDLQLFKKLDLKFEFTKVKRGNIDEEKHLNKVLMSSNRTQFYEANY